MLLKLYEGLTGTAYQGILTQYFDSGGNISSTVKASSYVDTSVAAPTELKSVEEIEAEITKASKAKGWPTELLAQFVVVTAPGTTYYENGKKLLENCLCVAWYHE